MKTPIVDFLRRYREGDFARFHMPGHKGRSALGCEGWDITEIAGADSLYEASGIIAESEENAAALFGTRRTCFSTEGSSQCLKAMLYLALQNRRAGTPPVIVAARNVHKAFLHAAALLDFEVRWLFPAESRSLCSCPISAEALERCLASLDFPPAAVYLTSPDYLGGMADIAALAEVAHRHGTFLAVDNAHGAYLRFLTPSQHPMDLGADLCCDSAHKTLPVLTGGAYLHISHRLGEMAAAQAKNALALFGSTSPSYLTLASLDLCNAALAGELPRRMHRMAERLAEVRASLRERGWTVLESDPLRLTIHAAGKGRALANTLRANRIECEYADEDFLVLMLTAENREEELQRLLSALGTADAPAEESEALPLARGKRAMSIREAFFRPHETVSAPASLGRICAAPTVSCPPAIPIVVSGEVIGEDALQLFRRYGVETVDVVKE